ncbi:hypothetical protein E0H89_01605 [Acinetobacter sp. ANC 3781]|nr:hypothetical protein E0H89_01605 [Acinetobacter sp. ANC 3781]
MYSKHARVVVPIKEYTDLNTSATGVYIRANILSDNKSNNKPFYGFFALIECLFYIRSKSRK